LPKFSRLLRRFSEVLSKFSRILPTFLTNQTFWGCICTPASYTTVAVSCFSSRIPLSPACATFLAELCNPITRQAIELESCSNPLRIQQVLQSKSKKKIFVFGGNVTSRGVFGYLYLALGPNSLGHYYGSRFFRKLGQNPRL